MAEARTQSAEKYALSKKILVVDSLIPEPIPPKTPAIHKLSCALQIIKSLAESVRSISSSVLNFVLSFCVFTEVSSALAPLDWFCFDGCTSPREGDYGRSWLKSNFY